MSRTADLCVWVRACVCASVVGFGAGFPPFLYGQQDFVSRSGNQGGTANASTLYFPSSIAFDSTGGLCIADFRNSRVLCYDSGSTTASSVYGQPDFVSILPNQGGTASASTLYYPIGIAFDNTGGLCITDASNSRVLCYSAGNTTASRVYGQPDFVSILPNQGGTASASTLSRPSGIAFDNTGGLCITDSVNNRVLCYSAGSTTAGRVYGQLNYFSISASQGGTASASTLYNPIGIAFDSAGWLCIADSLNSRVLCYGAGSTTASRVYGQPDFVSILPNQRGAASASTLYNPIVIAFDNTRGLCITESGNSRVLCYDAGGTTASSVYGQPDFVSILPNQGGTASASTLYFPRGIAFDNTGGPCIADEGNNRVLCSRITSSSTTSSTSTSTWTSTSSTTSSSTTSSTSTSTWTSTSSTTSSTSTSTWTSTSSTTSSPTTLTNWCIGFDYSLLDKHSKAYCKMQEDKAHYHTLWEQRSGAVSGQRIANISISSVMFLLWGILGATSLVAWRRGAWSRPAPLSDPGDVFLLTETDSLLSSDELVA
ncbi:unnamed protein product [Polarella glacialis]|uniref:Uncharacterized protein n=1 Tax=Polarella glacialis TaxID=89957 RepID=A0A813J7R1_POLGL|nr:unnamed protein product [Polarella glacialis]